MIKDTCIIEGASLVFSTYIINDITYYEFNSSEEECPIPMVNAMAGLKHLSNVQERLVMISIQEPIGLYQRIKSDFSWEVEEQKDELFKITFKQIDTCKNITTNFNNSNCNG